MDNINHEKSMRKFIEETGLSGKYNAWLKIQGKNLTEPPVIVNYTYLYRHSSEKIEINITPWLKSASPEEILHFMSIKDGHIPVEHEDFEFVDTIAVESMNTEQINKYFEGDCVDNTIDLCESRDSFKKKIKEIRSADYEEIQSLIR